MHQRTPQKMVYLGKPTCKDSCENYIEAVKFVFGAYKREAPLIINTMGWVTGGTRAQVTAGGLGVWLLLSVP